MIGWALVGAAVAGGPCDPAGVDKLVEALGQVRIEHRTALAAAGLGEACKGPLGPSAAAIGGVPPEMIPLLDAKAVLADPKAWIAACTGGLDVPQRVAQVAPAEKRKVLWEGCGLEATGWFAKSEWEGATGLWFLPILAAKALKDSGVADTKAREVVRALAGVGEAQAAEEPALPRLEPFLTPP